MKKLTVLISFLSCSLMHAQNNNTIDPPLPAEQSVFSIGPQGGFGHSFIMPFAGAKFQPSWDAGVAMIYSPCVHWGTELDIRYSVEGAKFKDVENVTSVTDLRYIRIPLKAVYFFRKYEDDFRPKITFGPTVGFLTEQINSRGARSTDFGVNASLGFHYRLVRAIWLTADANYYQGLLDVYAATSEKERNANIHLDIGISFGF
jgi:hypothetical protein